MAKTDFNLCLCFHYFIFILFWFIVLFLFAISNVTDYFIVIINVINDLYWFMIYSTYFVFMSVVRGI